MCSNVVFIILPPVASAPTNLMAVQEGPTSIRVSWSPPTPLGDTTGYRIYYSGGSSGSEDVSDGSTDNYLLTGLWNGESYTISIVATSQHLPSENIPADMEIMLGEDMYKSFMSPAVCTLKYMIFYIHCTFSSSSSSSAYY